jgi:ElaB/YqjD/DUF883 family membrane-anchored ribosome-binding protein
MVQLSQSTDRMELSAMGDTQRQINQLRSQVETLMRERVTPALADAANRAEVAVRRSQTAIRGQSEALSGQVRERPAVAVLVAAGIGYLLGRFLSP